MKNVPIDQFWSFKWRNGAQNWNLREKLSKIGPVGNFDFWSKVNTKSQSQSQLVQGQSQRILVRVGSGFSGRVTGRTVESLTSSYDVSMTWTKADVALADVDVLAWLLTWTDDIIRWRHMTSAAEFGACSVHRRVEEQPEVQVARGGACDIIWKPYFFSRQIGGRRGRHGGACTWKRSGSQESKEAQLVQGESQRILVRVGSGFPGRVTGRAVDPLTSSYDVSLWYHSNIHNMV